MKNEKGSSKILLLIFILVLIVIVAYFVFTKQNVLKTNAGASNLNTQSSNTNTQIANVNTETSNKNTSTFNTNTEVSNKIQNSTEKNYTKTTFKNEFGDGDKSITIEFEQCLRGSGYSGASSNVYYTKDGTLYHLELGNLKVETLATGVKNIEDSGEGIIAKVDKNYSAKIENNYIKYEN